MGIEALVPEPTSQEDRRKLIVRRFVGGFVLVCICVLVVVGIVFLAKLDKEESEKARLSAPDITIQSMDFTVLNVTDHTHLSVTWDLLIRIPRGRPGYYMCLNGDFQVLILYKNTTIASSSMKSYTLVIPYWAQQLRVSTIASEEDMDPVIVKDIMEVVKENGEIRFGSRLILPDCSYRTSGKMKYSCHEATLQFGSQRIATLFGNYPNCLYVP